MKEEEKVSGKKSGKSKSVFEEVICFGSRFIDYKMGAMGAVVMGSIVFAVNYYSTHEVFGATTAGLKQGAYTLLFGGIIMRSCEYLALRINKKAVAIAAAVIIPSAVAIALTFGVHSLKGTPRPVASTIPTALLIIPSTIIWGYRKRKRSANFPISNPKS